MSNNLEAIKDSEEYKELIAVRSKVKWTLTALMLLAYYSFILIIAFNPDFFAAPLGAAHTTSGIAVGLFIILFSFVITGIYVFIANKVLEPLTEQLHKAAAGE